ncbi:hypothetical protein [Clostridium gasigenes]|nr:hypothetical protein [Clostridium gasigenes]
MFKIWELDTILIKYQQFIKEQYSDKDAKFVEREGRLYRKSRFR